MPTTHLPPLRPIDPLLLKAEQQPTANREPVKVRLLGWLATQAALTILIGLFLSVNIGHSMSPTFSNFTVGVKVPDGMISQPKRGDIVTLRSNGQRFWWLNKRIVGLPGETISISHGQVIINGTPLSEPYLADGVSTASLVPVKKPALYLDAVKAGCSNHRNMYSPSPHDPKLRIWECQLAPDHVFVLGDNREHSFDSRQMGPIHTSKIESRTVFTLYPFHQLGAI